MAILKHLSVCKQWQRICEPLAMRRLDMRLDYSVSEDMRRATSLLAKLSHNPDARSYVRSVSIRSTLRQKEDYNVITEIISLCTSVRNVWLTSDWTEASSPMFEAASELKNLESLRLTGISSEIPMLKVVTLFGHLPIRQRVDTITVSQSCPNISYPTRCNHGSTICRCMY